RLAAPPSLPCARRHPWARCRITAERTSGSRDAMWTRRLVTVALVLTWTAPLMSQTQERPRARDAGVIVGILPPGPLNAITDVEGVAVGHATVIEGDGVRTGVTAILPHGGNPFLERVP